MLLAILEADNLRPTGHSRLISVQQGAGVSAWMGTNDGHFTAQDIDEQWQLLDAGSSQDSAHSR
jgi:hypothetical protein